MILGIIKKDGLDPFEMFKNSDKTIYYITGNTRMVPESIGNKCIVGEFNDLNSYEKLIEKLYEVKDSYILVDKFDYVLHFISDKIEKEFESPDSLVCNVRKYTKLDASIKQLFSSLYIVSNNKNTVVLLYKTRESYKNAYETTGKYKLPFLTERYHDGIIHYLNNSELVIKQNYYFNYRNVNNVLNIDIELLIKFMNDNKVW